MAQLKDTIVSGSLRATDTIYTTTLQAQNINAPTISNGTTYSHGANGQVLKSNGSTVYWDTMTPDQLNLANAMHFIGVATVAITDGSTTNPAISGYNFATEKSAGDVIIDKDSHREYVWSTAGKWEMLGFDASQQFSKTTTGNTFISSVTQNTDGTVSADSRALNTSGDWTGNAGSATKLKTARNLAVALGSTTAVTFDGTANCTSIPVSGVLGIAHGGTGATSFVSGNLLVGNGQNALTTIAKTSANNANTVVERDASGNFAANTITASTITSNDTLIIQTTEAEKALTLKSNYTIFIDRGDNTSIVFRKNGTENARFNSAGNFVPGTTNTLGLGTDSLRWKNVYATNIYGTVDHATTTLDNTSALHPVGVTSSAKTTLKYDDGIAMTGGQINAEKFRINDQACFEYNSTDDTIDLIWG